MRYAHLLAGAVAVELGVAGMAHSGIADVSTAEVVALRTTVAQMRTELDALQAMVQRLYQELEMKVYHLCAFASGAWHRASPPRYIRPCRLAWGP